MIADKITNAKLYYSLSDRIEIGLKYLQETDFSKMELGKYPIDGDNIFAILNTYNTKPLEEAKTENHNNYLDIQYIVKGAEHMGYAAFKGQEPSVGYNQDKDVTFYKCEVSKILFEEGSFAIFLPDDIHTPGVAIDQPAEVTKVVVKIKL